MTPPLDSEIHTNSLLGDPTWRDIDPQPALTPNLAQGFYASELLAEPSLHDRPSGRYTVG